VKSRFVLPIVVVAVALATFQLVRCKGSAPPELVTDAAAPSTSSAKRTLDEAEYCHILDLAADSIDRDLKAAAADPRMTPEQARTLLAASGPAGSKPRVLAIAKAEGFTEDEVTQYVHDQPDPVDRCASKFVTRLEGMTDAINKLTLVAGQKRN
jgi:hypothetical protein